MPKRSRSPGFDARPTDPRPERKKPKLVANGNQPTPSASKRRLLQLLHGRKKVTARRKRKTGESSVGKNKHDTAAEAGGELFTKLAIEITVLGETSAAVAGVQQLEGSHFQA